MNKETFEIHCPHRHQSEVLKIYHSLPKAEQYAIRCIAETIAIIDGNAFFGISRDASGDDTHYQSYLNSALAIWEQTTDWKEESFLYRTFKPVENKAVEEAFEHYQTLHTLVKKHT